MEAHILFYDYVEDVLERRGPLREAHSAIVFQVPPEQIEAFLREDPYVQGGLVREWRIEPWKLV